MSPEAELRNVIAGGYCVGCGACAALDPAISIGFDDVGRLQAHLPEDRAPSGVATAACPFSGVGPDEDALAKALFTDRAIVTDFRIGRHLACFAGWVEEDGLRARASSGGIGTWLQSELLSKGLVDAVLNVTPRTGHGTEPLFSFTVARSPEEVMANAKTRYYPIEMSGVIDHVLANPGRYAAIGTPCFAKALRLAARQSPELKRRLSFVLGIVCGHLKTTAFARALAAQCDMDPDRVETIDFRSKLKGRPASRYGVSVSGVRRDGSHGTVTRPMEGLIGENWGHGLFKYKACEFCDDVLAETADAVVGDAWLPDYESDHRGANVVVVRQPLLRDLLLQARAAGRLHLDELSADDVAASQAGGLRHRRDGLAYRLWLTDRTGAWRPRKRVSPNRRHLAPSMRRVHAARYALGQASHVLWRDAPDMEAFTARIGPMIAAYDRLINPGLARRALRFIERKLDAALFRAGLRR
ncbi:MAG: Coenzyme F420 hydrogenase/dehydrogenase, beta subunit C-terminal domain [Paracoccaceae bacterium]|nr:Coenzyme F420 hydrogenase/dehydrogenase, beta subunit C-terminal domain [Paracoccaceae bacterium]